MLLIVFNALHVLCLLGIAAGLVLLNIASNNYKPTSTQCLLNVGPATPVRAGQYLFSPSQYS